MKDSIESTAREDFKPIAVGGSNTWQGWVAFKARQLIDFQVLTVHQELSKFLHCKKGIVVDVGCGDEPYRHLFKDSFDYIGLDIGTSSHFGVTGGGVRFDGANLPLRSESVDYIVCTEVLEHVLDFRHLVSELHRILKPGGEMFVTIPWSARYHYKPYDYHRFSPSALERVFQEVVDVAVNARGTDLTTVANKIIVIIGRQFVNADYSIFLKLLWLPLAVPCLVAATLMGHLSLWCNVGSQDDPLGWTIRVRK